MSGDSCAKCPLCSHLKLTRLCFKTLSSWYYPSFVMSQLFWNAYKRLEKEVLALSEVIHFDDYQKRVYSSRIGDLLVRTVIEIESLSKVLYDAEGGTVPSGRDLYFDTDCLALLEEKWILSRKVIYLNSSFFYFEDESFKVLTPLKKAYKRGTSSSKWKQAYQAVKHDRVNQIRRGNIENLLTALGALYILNLYYRNSSIENVSDKDASNIDWGLGSEIFTVKFSPESGGVSSTKIYEPKSDYEECIYLVKHTDESAQAFIDLMQVQNKIMVEKAQIEVANFIINELTTGSLDLNDKTAIQAAADHQFNESYRSALNQVVKQNGHKISSAITGLRFEAVLNKQQF